MSSQNLSAGVVHKLPKDLEKVLNASQKAKSAWEDITPLARNEWICWVESAKQQQTRKRRVERTGKELADGVRRPCCWIGCIHRKDKEISPSVKWVLDKQSKSK